MNNDHTSISGRAPLVHCITNPVTINDCANALLAVGASPIMSTNPLETAEVTSHADALVINLGHTTTPEAVIASALAAKEKGIPVIIDPVGTGVSGYRRKMFLDIVKAASPSLIRGNASEIRTLLSLVKENAGTSEHDASPETFAEKGVDVSAKDVVTAENISVWAGIAKDLARVLSCIVVLSGTIDIVTDGEKCATVSGGSSMMRRITGSGCMLSSICGAALAAADDPFIGARNAVILMNKAAEIAENNTAFSGGGPGTFHIMLIDALAEAFA